MSLVGDGGGEEDLCHVHSGGHSLTYVPVGDGGGEVELWHVRSGGHSVTHVPSGRRGRRGGSLPCTQWGTLSGLCTQWGMGEERSISAMYPVGDAQWLMYPVGDGGGEENLCHVPSGGCSVAYVPSRGRGRREGSLPCTQWGTLSDTCP